MNIFCIFFWTLQPSFSCQKTVNFKKNPLLILKFVKQKGKVDTAGLVEHHGML